MPQLKSHPLASSHAPTWATEWGCDEYGPWACFELKDVKQRLRWIPEGAFEMGSPRNERGSQAYERPQHTVHITSGFWLFETPCTQALWIEVMKNNPSKFNGNKRPVEKVSWDDVAVFINRFNELMSAFMLKLPTEAQWEYACRAGSKALHYGIDQNLSLDKISWYWENGEQKTHDVGFKQANRWGLCDMLGNVWEWCLDSRRSYSDHYIENPCGDVSAMKPAVRGGSWGSSPSSIRAAHRGWYHRHHRDELVGFRPILDCCK